MKCVLEATVDEDGTRYVGCPLCGAALPLLQTKKDLPYLSCPACRLRMFVNGRAGEDRLNALFGDGKEE